MTRKILLTGPALAHDAMSYANDLDIQIFPSTPYLPAEELTSLIRDVQPDAIIVRQGRLTREMIEASPRLKAVAKHGVGYDTIDIQAAAEKGVPVMIALGANAQSVAEHAFALMFSVARHIAWLDARTRQGHWDKATANGIELFGKTLGLVGLGAIGSVLMDLVAPLQMKVKVFDPYLKTLPERSHVERETDFDRLIESSDIISLHCPLTDENRNLISTAQLNRMRSNCILINTARGELVDTQALIQALQTNRIAGAGLDTFNPEPPAADSPLWQLPNLVATPHTGANTTESRDRVGLLAVQQIVKVWDGDALDPRCIVNRQFLDS
ncbi:hydroxyacid dehydrogenase [Pseudomonas syringae]|uniref:hydroxyacid dehydrogenase n=1 Tax=Pseudomonas syringae TaxID=317 RepID=UPI0022492EB7|nr:hydroxyacid dehydrogenase [Pseudomonas syringae]UZS70268.1 hydroxyacid dehydrogenase [Pseudomonas syringae]